MSKCLHALALPQEHILSKFEVKFEGNMSRDYFPLGVVSIALIVLSSILLLPKYFIWYPYLPGDIDEKMVALAVTKGSFPATVHWIS